jgi:transcriptional regulator with XRE-family HTH domain
MRSNAGDLQLTRLASILDNRNLSYTAVAERAHLQPRTIRQLASGETPIDNVAVGTVRKIAAALSLPVAALLDSGPAYPGDASLSRAARLSAAIREVMWQATPIPYVSPLEDSAPDDVTSLPADEFFADMPAIDARRG